MYATNFCFIKYFKNYNLLFMFFHAKSTRFFSSFCVVIFHRISDCMRLVSLSYLNCKHIFSLILYSCFPPRLEHFNKKLLKTFPYTLSRIIFSKFQKHFICKVKVLFILNSVKLFVSYKYIYMEISIQRKSANILWIITASLIVFHNKVFAEFLRRRKLCLSLFLLTLKPFLCIF